MNKEKLIEAFKARADKAEQQVNHLIHSEDGQRSMSRWPELYYIASTTQRTWVAAIEEITALEAGERT
jgi:hypothetical protein